MNPRRIVRMNTQLVDFIVQTIANLAPAERELVKQKLLVIDGADSSENLDRSTLAERKAFLSKPLAERRSILAKQAQSMVKHYEESSEWR